MNKNQLVEAVIEKTKLSRADSNVAVDAILEAITRSLQKGEEVRLVGFGTFSVAEYKARVGRNPRSGEKIDIPATKQPKFKAGKPLRAAVN